MEHNTSQKYLISILQWGWMPRWSYTLYHLKPLRGSPDISGVLPRVSRDLKVAAIRLFELGHLPLPDILLCCRISRRSFYRILHLWRTTGDVVNDQTTSSQRSRVRGLNRDDVQYLLQLIRTNPDYFLDELLDLLKTNRFISVHYSTIHQELTRAGVSRKRLQRIALERNEARRAQYITRMARYEPEELGFIDEVSKDERTCGRRYRRSKRGTRARKAQPFVRGQRMSTVGVLTLNGFVSGMVVEGSLTKVALLHWLEFSVVRPRPSLSRSLLLA